MTLAPDILRMAGRLGRAFCLRKPFSVSRGRSQMAAAIEACLDRLPQQRRDALVMFTGEWIGADAGNSVSRSGARNRRRNARGST